MGRLDTKSALAFQEKVHIVEHKRFEADTRRHFVGEVQTIDPTHLRVHGYPFVYDGERGRFIRVEPERVCVFANDNNISITILPPEFDIESAGYERIGTDIVFKDGNDAELEIGSFGRAK